VHVFEMRYGKIAKGNGILKCGSVTSSLNEW
jgi:hypothetical protein